MSTAADCISKACEGMLAALARACSRGACALAFGALLSLAIGCGPGDEPARSPMQRTERAAAAGPLRVVSINPSLTAILIALDAADVLVGVDDFSAAQQPEVEHLPRVGGLFNPSLESVAALQPDLVILVPSVEQRDFRARLTQLGVDVAVFQNIRFEEVLHNITELGELVDRRALAAERVRAISASRAAAEQLALGARRQKTALVLQRDPVFLVGTGGFLDELLAVAGADNIGASFDDPYPQVAVEWLVGAAPEVLIDMTEEPGDPLDFWSRWPAIPAVANRQVVHLDPKIVILPGPYLDRAIAALVSVLHGAAAADSVLAHAGDLEVDL